MKNIKTFNQYNLNESIFSLSPEKEQFAIEITQYVLDNYTDRLLKLKTVPNKFLKYFTGKVLNLNILENDVKKSLEKTNEEISFDMNTPQGLINCYITLGIVIGTTGTLYITIPIIKEIIRYIKYKKNIRNNIINRDPNNFENDPFGEEYGDGHYRIGINIGYVTMISILFAIMAVMWVIGYSASVDSRDKGFESPEKGKIVSSKKIEYYEVLVEGKEKTYTLKVPMNKISDYKVGDSTDIGNFSNSKENPDWFE